MANMFSRSTIGAEGNAKLNALAAEHTRSVHERALQSGHAKRDKSGKVTIDRKAPKRLEIPVDGKLNSVVWFLDQTKNKKRWPTSSDLRQKLRLAIVGWLMHEEHLPEHVVLATMLAITGGHPSIPNMVRSTSMKIAEGRHISGWETIQQRQLLSEPDLKMLGHHFLTDMKPWRDERDEAIVSRKLEQADVPSELETPPEQDDPQPPVPEEDHEPPQPAQPTDADHEHGPGCGYRGHEHDHNEPEPEFIHELEQQPAPAPEAPRPIITIGFKTPTAAELPAPIPLMSTSGPPEPPPEGAYPRSPQSLALSDAAEAARRGELWEAEDDSGLALFRRILLEIVAKLDKKYHSAVETLIGHQLGMALIGPKTAGETLKGTPFMRAAKMGRHGTIVSITAWRRGKTVAPKLMRWDVLRKWGVHHRDLQRLLSALAKGLREQGAPTRTRRNAMIDQPWRDNERRFLDDVCAAFAKDKRPAAKALYEAARCMSFATRKKCPDHGDRGYYYLRCKREIACPCCRSFFYEFIHEWIVEQKRWPDELLAVVMKPVEGEVVVSDHETIEEDNGDQIGDKDKAPPKKGGIVISPGGSFHGVVLPKPAVKKPAEPEKAEWDMTPEELKEHQAREKEERRLKRKNKKRKKVGSHVSTLFMDRLRAAFRLDPGMRELLARTKKLLGIRAWAGVKHAIMFMPAFFDDETGTERITAEYLSMIGAFQGPEYQLKRVTRDEACAMLLECREEVARQFDHAVLEATKEAGDALLAAGAKWGYQSQLAEEAYQAKVRELGERLLSMEHLKPGAMRPIKKTRKAEFVMPWFTDEDQKRMMQQKLKAEGKDRDHCDYLVKKHEGDLGHKCGKLLETLVEDAATEEVLLKNRNGYTPSREEVYEAARSAGKIPGRRVDPPERVLAATG